VIGKHGFTYTYKTLPIGCNILWLDLTFTFYMKTDSKQR